MSDFNLGWKFHMGDIEGAWQKGFDDGAWREVTLPHDWSVEAPFDVRHSSGTGYLPGGVAFYRKTFTLPADAVNKTVGITFDGVYKNAQIWFNGNYLGYRPYGYTTFSFDVTAFCAFGKDSRNVVAVKVTHEDVADSRWFTGSGIYRKVSLSIKNKEHIKENGLFIYTERADGESAALRADVSAIAEQDCEIRVRIFTADGICVTDCAGEAVPDGVNASYELTVEKPRLWSTDDPYLYRAVVELMRGGRVLDCVGVSVGIRTFAFDAENGFTLNGVSMKLKGVCVHHDAGCLGAAVHAKVWRDRLLVLKSVGANAIRTAHNPPMPELLDLCDELGFLVIDEAFDEWEGSKNKWSTGHNVYPPKHYGYFEHFPEWHDFDLSQMVLRDRNHPSVIMWSVGNEIDYPNDPYCHPAFGSFSGNNDANKPSAEMLYNPDKPNAERLPVIARNLIGTVKSYDPTRPVSAAVAFPELSNLTGYSACFDVIGYNYKEHLYGEVHKEHPDWILLGSENGHGYDRWAYVRDNPYISGQFLWTGIDYLGETRGWPQHGSAAGMLDLKGRMKPRAYFRQSLWTEGPYAKLFARNYAAGADRRSYEWRVRETEELRENWNFAEGAPVEVICYANGAKVSLYLDGVLIGEQPVDQNEAVWQIPYRPGILKAVADNGASDSMSPVSAPVLIILETSDTEIYADGRDIAIIRASVADFNGRVADDSCHMISVAVDGGALLGIENGDLSDTQEYALARRRAFNGRFAIYVRADEKPGVMRVRATSPKLRPAELKINKV